MWIGPGSLLLEGFRGHIDDVTVVHVPAAFFRQVRERASGYIVCLKIFDKLRVQRSQDKPVHVQREIKNQAQPSHTNIIQLLGSFYDEAHIHLILEYAARPFPGHPAEDRSL
jgi:hypothetical protein